jgi:phage tail-like protein
MIDEKLSSYYFTVEIDGIQTDRFLECEGLEMEARVFEVEEGGLNISTHKRIGTSRSPSLILKKGVNKNNELINWYQNNINGNFERKNISIILMNSAHEEIRRWDIYRAFPIRWKCAPLDTNDNIFLVETIEIAYE